MEIQEVKNPLLKEEILIGSIYVLIFGYWINYYTLIFMPLSGFLWALSGSSSKYNWKIFRRLGCPLCVAIPLFLTGHDKAFWGIPVAFAFLSCGYGISDYSDKGSMLGRLF